MKGIDISSGSGGVDFQGLKRDGYDFVIVRAGWGSDTRQEDQRFDYYVRAALDAGLHVGAYWFIYARSVEEARINGECFVQVLERFKGRLDLPMYIDYEYDSTRYYEQYIGKETRQIATDMISAAAQEVEKSGYYTGVYLNPDYIRNHVNLDPLKRFTLWLAEWKSPDLKPTYECDMWQYAGDTKIVHAFGGVDLNLCFGSDLPAVIRSGGFNGFAPKESVNSSEIDPGEFFGRPVRILSNGSWEFL